VGLLENLLDYMTFRAKRYEGGRLLDLSADYYEAARFDEALGAAEQALAIFREIGDRERQMLTLGNVAAVHLLRGEYESATELNRERYDLAVELDDLRAQGLALGDLGTAFYLRGDNARALEYYSRHLDLARRAGDKESEANALGNLGNTYSHMGDFRRAAELHLQTLAIERERKNTRSQAHTLSLLGNTYAALGRYRDALACLTEGLALARAAHDPRIEAVTLGNSANVYTYLGRYDEALACFERSVELLRAMGDRYAAARFTGELAALYLNIGAYRRGVRLSEQYLELARGIQDSTARAQALVNLGVGHLGLEEYDEAESCFEQSLAIKFAVNDRRGAGIVYGNLGTLNQERGRPEEALASYYLSLTITSLLDHPAAAQIALNNLGNTYYSLGEHVEAARYHRQALALARKIEDPSGAAVALNNFGAVQLADADAVAAEKSLREATVILDSLRARLGDDSNKVSIFEGQARTYSLLQRALVAQGRTEEALVAAEQGRTRAFVETLFERSIGDPTSAHAPAAPTLEEIRRTARDRNATLIEYSLISGERIRREGRKAAEMELLIWVVSPSGRIDFRRHDITGLWRLLLGGGPRREFSVARESPALPPARPFEVAGEVPSWQTDTQMLSRWYEALIAPVADLLPTKPDAPVIFIPQGPLFAVPFHALSDGDSYLIERHPIVTSPSIKMLEHTERHRRAALELRRNPLIVGNPQMPEWADAGRGATRRLLSLPEAEREASEIARLFGVAPVVGTAATKEAVLRDIQRRSIIHLATHGMIGDTNALDIPGALALAPSAGDDAADAVLYAGEVANLNISAGLVVLSACETGQGRVTGDGVLGLSRSFILAGAPSVVVSLWRVYDGPTADLMTEFYRCLLDGAGKADALRSAMLLTMRRHPHPLYWAAFTLIGEHD
jgi:tetratricopeptide (TPR) repeat protein